MRVAIITANTAVYREKEEDAAGKVIKKMIEQAGHTIVFQKALPCDRTVLSTVMQRMADGHLTDLILTTGGAGCNAGDCTPEATMDVVERAVPGIPEAMRWASLQITKRAMLSRAAAGIRKQTLIINLPGSPKAVRENLEFIMDSLHHGLEILKGQTGECART